MEQWKYRKRLSIVLIVLLVMQGFSAGIIPAEAAAGTKIGTMTVGISKSESGSTLTFTASPSTTYTGGTYSYQWQMSSDNGTSWSNISGATNSTYSVNTKSLSSAYRYRCQSNYTFTSDESYALINDAYLSFLNRNAENNGNQYWWNLLTGHTISNIARIATDKFSLSPVNEAACVAIVIGVSPEGASRGNLSQGSEAFITACYDFLLGTTPDSSGLAYWKSIYEQYEGNTAYITYNGIDYGTINEGAVRVVNGIASNSSCGTYMSNKYAYNTSTGKYTYTQAETYIQSSTYYVSGTSKSIAVPEYSVTCEDRVDTKSGTLLGTQSTVKKYTNGNSVKGSVWGSDASDNAYYRGYKYAGCSTLTVNGAGTVYRYFSLLPDNVTYDYTTNGGTSITITDNTVYYPVGENIDLNPKASKDGYTLIGWNTDKDARTALSSVKSTSAGVTLYAIYRKDIVYKYHASVPANDYSETGYLFNKETTVYADTDGASAMNYKPYTELGLTEDYDYEGYTLSSDKNDNAGLFTSGAVTESGTDIYCVYSVNGTLEYYDTGNVKIESASDTFYGTVAVLPYASFSYVAKSYTPSKYHQFDGWLDGDNTYQAGDTITSASTLLKVYASESPIKAVSLSVRPKNSEIKKDDTLQLSADVLPEDALERSVTWVSSDPTIASVNEDGLVTAHKAGTVTITATTKDGSNLSDTADVTVLGRVIYDAETNGGTSCDKKYSDGKLGTGVNLSVKAFKEGYEFIGWSTSKDSHEPVKTILYGDADITLYAIFRKHEVFKYHLYDVDLDVEQDVYLFNNEDVYYADVSGGEPAVLIDYNHIKPDERYKFVGYTFNRDADSLDDVDENIQITVGTPQNIYCLYELTSVMQFYKSRTMLKEDRQTRYASGPNITSLEFTFHDIPDCVADEGYKFLGWSVGVDRDMGKYLAVGDSYTTSDLLTKVYAVQRPIRSDEDPTTEEPTTEVTTETTTEEPTTEVTTETTTEEPTTEVKPIAGPITGDSTLLCVAIIWIILSGVAMLIVVFGKRDTEKSFFDEDKY